MKRVMESINCTEVVPDGGGSVGEESAARNGRRRERVQDELISTVNHGYCFTSTE